MVISRYHINHWVVECSANLQMRESICVCLRCNCPRFQISHWQKCVYGVILNAMHQYYVNNKEVDMKVAHPQFAFPFWFWSSSEYSVKVTITDSNIAELFYFCAIHPEMGGRIILVNGIGSPQHPSRVGNLELAPLYIPDKFDTKCGTYKTTSYSSEGGGLEMYCPKMDFLCGTGESELKDCVQAINCKMNFETRIYPTEENEVATFMHQAIGHHGTRGYGSETLHQLMVMNSKHCAWNLAILTIRIHCEYYQRMFRALKS